MNCCHCKSPHGPSLSNSADRLYMMFLSEFKRRWPASRRADVYVAGRRAAALLTENLPSEKKSARLLLTSLCSLAKDLQFAALHSHGRSLRYLQLSALLLLLLLLSARVACSPTSRHPHCLLLLHESLKPASPRSAAPCRPPINKSPPRCAPLRSSNRATLA